MQSVISQTALSRLSIWQLLVVTILGVLLLGGVLRAFSLAWISDDAFISIRYAENLISGNGLVYNPGEYVEGYTNLLWTLLLAGLMRAGFSPVPAAEYLGIFFYVALVLCLAHWTWWRARESGRSFLPLAAGLVLVSDDFHTWATGGLETMLFAYLALQALLLTRLEVESRRLPLLVGVLLSLLVLTRPDGLLFAAVGVASYWIPPGRLPQRTRIDYSLTALAPVLVTLAVLIPVKLSYYGDVFPTAFYSKSVLRPYISQGLVYVAVYLAKNWFLVAVLAAMLIARVVGRRFPRGPNRYHSVVFLAAAGVFVAYLVQVGGDFMFARRLIPAIPFLFLVLEESVMRVEDIRFRTGCVGVCLVAAALHAPLYSDERLKIRGIADERRFYPQQVLRLRELQAKVVGEALAGTPARVAIEGGMCGFAYYSGLPYLVEMTGLTQYSLAKLPLSERGHVGHEKAATDEWLTENNIHLVVSQALPPVSRSPASPGFRNVYFGRAARARIHLYSDEVMDALRQQPQVSFVPIEDVIAGMKQRIENSSAEEAEGIYDFLDRYYFRAAGERGQEEARAIREMIERKRGD